MQISDTIADLLTRIRNASTAKHATVDIPASNVKKSITQILADAVLVSSSVEISRLSETFVLSCIPVTLTSLFIVNQAYIDNT